MITGMSGGVVQRSMPPVDWDCGPIPKECYETTSLSAIEALLYPIYLDPERVRRLAGSDEKLNILQAKLALEILVEIDAKTILCCNWAEETCGT